MQPTARHSSRDRTHLVTRPQSRGDCRLRSHGGPQWLDDFPDLPRVWMGCRSLGLRGRPSDERGPGHQVECRIFSRPGPGQAAFGGEGPFRARGDNLPVAVGSALLPGRAAPVWPMRSLRKLDTVGSHSPKRGTNSSRFSPKSGTRNPWRRLTLRARGMPLAHECSGDRHYPYGSGFGNKEEQRRENAGSEAASLRQPPISIANGRH